jgi:predicted deacylase
MSEKEVLEILGVKVLLGESTTVFFNVAKLHTQNKIDVPVIIERSKTPGPTVLITAGIHGDEINGVEIVRQIIAKGINKPKKGTIICIPVINVFGFIQMDREFPDGRDLNRVFPGSRNGALAGRVAHKLTKEIIPHADLILDFHTGGADRFNSAQVRIIKGQTLLDELAEVFGAPFVYYSKNLTKSFRSTAFKLGIPMLLFEGGKSFNIDAKITNSGVNGAKRVLNHLGMLRLNYKVTNSKKSSVYILESKWIRAKYSGMFKASVSINSFVNKNDVIGHITDPYGSFNHFIKAPNCGYLFNINESPFIKEMPFFIFQPNY